MTDPAQIAKSLNEAQRRQFLHRLLADGWYYKGVVGDTAISMPAVCVEYVTTQLGFTKYRLTPLGLAVRAILEKETP